MTLRKTGRRGIGEPAAVTNGARGRSRVQTLMALICAVGVFVGVRMSHVRNKTAAPAQSAQAVEGTWELQSINGDPVGQKADSVILSQRMTLRGGRIEGETRLPADTPAATTSMPFPDESVERVEASADGHEVTVSWSGTYSRKSDRVLELQIGQATYRAALTLDPVARTLEMDHDAILTFKGPARYQAVPAAQSLARRSP